MSFLDRFRGRRPKSHAHSQEDLAALDVKAPGWRAIDHAVDPLYGGREPELHWGTIVRWRLGGPDPLDGISAYRADHPPHWHFVSYGLSELYQKESDDKAVSGWGFELTFRLARAAGDRQVPLWPIGFLQNLARYVFQSGNVLNPGDHLDLHGPIALERETSIRAALFALDPQLDSIDTANGRLQFVQVVGITLDEYQATQEWISDEMIKLLARRSPMLVTDLDRRSILEDPDVRDQVTTGIAGDGSSMSGLVADVLSISAVGASLTVHLGAAVVERVLRLMAGRLGHDRSFWIRSPNAEVSFQRGDDFAWHAVEGGAHVTLSPTDVDQVFREVRAEAGRYAVGPDGRLVFEVERTVIRDRQDREIGHVG